MYDSVSTWRLYSAEQSLPLGEPLPDIQSAQALVRRVRRSAWWKRNVEYKVTIRVVLGGAEDAGWVRSFAQPNGVNGDKWMISLHPLMLNNLIVLHELAHCVAPRMILSGRRRRRTQLHSHAQHPSHGAGFAGAFAELVREFADGEADDGLRSAYEHFGVPAMTLDEYRRAVSESQVAEADELQLRAETRDYFDNHPVEAPPGGWKVPEYIWGYTLWLARINPRRSRGGAGRRLGLDRLAKQISGVERCTRRDLTLVESARMCPEDPHLRRVAMCHAVAMNLDPIYMRHVMGLVRWDCNITLDELRAINPDWVDLVEAMNQLLAQRPPRWAVQGDR